MARVKALIVDDSAADRDLVRRALTRNGGGFTLTEAASREELEARLTGEPFDVVISDYDIAGFTGLEVLDVVRGLQPQTPVVLVTGTGSEQIAVDALHRGAADYVVKSVGHIKRLPTTITAVLDRAAMVRERAALQEHLRRSEGRYRALVETAGEAILSVQPDGKVGFFSRGAERIFGYAAEEVVGKGVAVLVPADGEDLTTLAARANAADNDAAGICAVEMVRRDGSRFPAELTFSAFAADGGVAFTIIIRDVTAKRRLQAEVARLDRLAAIGEMVTGIAHEVRNPLAVIATSAAVVKTELAAAGLDTDGADWIMGGVARIETLLSRFFAFAKPLEIKRRACDLNLLLRAALADEGPAFARAGVRVVWALDAGLPAVNADADLVGVVATNVAKNAREAMPGGGVLTVRTDRVENGGERFARAAFADTGVGIPPESKGRLSEPFFTTKADGVGLGLPLCYKIIRGHGGEFAVAGRERGAEVTFTLPLGG
jgi:PAS domain S-box-containing protein